MVVYIHSRYLEAEQYSVVLFSQKLTGGVCRIANCLFFCISGYLLARDINSIKDVWPKLRKRIRTFVIPYLLWNMIFVLWYVALENIPGIDRFSNTSGTIERYLSQPIYESLYDLFVAPAAFQLWFLRDLLVMLALTPLLWWVTKKQWVTALILALCSIAVYPWLVYFWMGIIIVMKQWDIENYPKPTWAVTISTVIFIGYVVYLASGKESIPFVEMTVNLIGLYVMWSLYDIFARGKCPASKGLWKYICGYSFFIYCFHEPTFNVVKKLALAVCGTSQPVLIFFYYLNPLMMIIIAVLTAKLLQCMTPRIYKILTGGR
jgi:surface polysaccharide O-acyltransferase-like enzyme